MLCLWKPASEPQQHISSRTWSGQAASEVPLHAVRKTGWSDYDQHPWLWLGAVASSCPFCVILLQLFNTTHHHPPETSQCMLPSITAMLASLHGESQHTTRSWTCWIQKMSLHLLQFTPVTWPENTFYVMDFLMPQKKSISNLSSEKLPDGASKALCGPEKKVSVAPGM